MMKPTHLLVAATLCGSITACSKDAAPPTAPVRPVYTFTVEEPADTYSRRFSGAAQSAEGSDLSFEVGGRVVSLAAKVGNEYKAGDVLAKLDETDYRNQLTSSQAVFDQASEEMKRTRILFEQSNASKSQFDGAVAQFRSAQANLESARKRVEDCTLHMPYTGRIGNVAAEEQQVVSPGTPVISIQGEGNMEMEIGVPAELIRSFRTGMTGNVTFSARPGQIYQGTVTEVSPQIGGNTTYPVTMVLTPVDDGLVDGMDGEAEFAFARSNGGVLSIPAGCVVGAPGDTRFVWTVVLQGDNEGTVQRRTVTVGELVSQDHIEIVNGVAPGERVVTRGVHRLEEGTAVTLLDQ